MTRTQKLTLIALAVIGLLFALSVGLGLTSPGGCDRSPRECAESHPPPSGIRSLGAMLGGLGPRAVIEPARREMAQGERADLAVPADPKADSPRTLTLVLRQGQRASLEFHERDPARNPVKEEQQQTLPRSVASKDEDPMRASFTVSPAGGSVEVFCLSGPRCVIELP